MSTSHFFQRILNHFAPVTRSVSWSSVVAYSAGVLLIAGHIWTVNRFAVNVPYIDDYTFIINAINSKATPPVAFLPLVDLIFHPHGEHLILFARLTALLSYLIEGELNFRTLYAVGNLTLLGTAWLLFRVSRRAGLTPLQILPVFLLLFQPQYYENTTTWAICGLQHVAALFFALGAFALLSRSSRAAFAGSLPLAFLATCSNGNGPAVLLVGFLILLVLGRPGRLLVWSLFAGLTLWLYAHYYQLGDARQVTNVNLLHPLRVLGGFFFMTGSMMFLFSRSLLLIGLSGVLLTGVTLVILVPTLGRYPGVAHWLDRLPAGWRQYGKRWPVLPAIPASLTLMSGYTYVAVTMAGIAFARDVGWHYSMLLPRTIWFGTVAGCFTYLIVMVACTVKIRLIISWFALIGGIFFTLVSYYYNLEEVKTIYKSQQSDMHNWRTARLITTLPSYTRQYDVYYTKQLKQAIADSVYRLPEPAFQSALFHPIDPATLDKLIEKDSAFTFGERQHRLLVLAPDALPPDFFNPEDGYLLLRSTRHTLVWPVNRSRTKAAQFLLTGQSDWGRDMVLLFTDILPPDRYQVGIMYRRQSTWLAGYSRQFLTIQVPKLGRQPKRVAAN